MVDLRQGQRWVGPDGRWLEIGCRWCSDGRTNVRRSWGWSTVDDARLSRRITKDGMRLETTAEREARLAVHAAFRALNRRAGVHLRQAKRRAAALAELLSGPQQGSLFGEGG